ncbi:MAG: SEC-C metal-binding domain-containing protein [Christensenellaceae bacterium]|jgi:uncharacterized protein YecA (UPF0149 family)
MSLYETWQQMAEMQPTEEAQLAYWNEYFAAETENYKKILAEKDKVFAGTVKELAETFEMPEAVFVGFMDGINESLVSDYEVEALKEDSEISLEVDFEKLYFNMLNAKAKWLYTLPEWEDVLKKEKRQEITKAWRLSKQIVNEQKVGRNDPCPCGSGKKYKKCCGRAETA